MDKKSKEATPLTEEQLLKKEADLKTQSEQLAKDRADFEAEKSDFQTKSEKLKSDIEEFEDFQEKVFEVKEKFEAREKAVEARENAVSEKENYIGNSPEFSEEEKIETFEFEGEEIQFSASAPQVINYGGQKFTRKELIENEAVLLELIGGNSNLFIKKYL